VIDESDSQSEKHTDSRMSAVLGIMIDWSDDNSNACNSICVDREIDWNVIDENDFQPPKHAKPRIWTLLGITIDWSNDSVNAEGFNPD
jgi:hypothetical protein